MLQTLHCRSNLVLQGPSARCGPNRKLLGVYKGQLYMDGDVSGVRRGHWQRNHPWKQITHTITIIKTGITDEHIHLA